MGKSIDSTRHEFATVRTGRASPHLLDRVNVDYYGAQTPLNQIATVNASEARLLTITPYDKTLDQVDREGDPGVRPRPHAVQRREPDPAHDSRADRGAPQGAREGRAPARRGGARGGPEHPPRLHAPPARPAQERRRRARTRSAGRRPSCRSSPTPRSRTSTSCSKARKKRSSADERSPAVRGDHHGWERALGHEPGAGRHRGAPGRHGRAEAHRGRRRRPRHRRADRVRVLDRELAAARRRGERHHGAVRGPHQA